jgi:hypothetical protein
MKILFLLLGAVVIATAGTIGFYPGSKQLQATTKTPMADTVEVVEVPSAIKRLFYNLPLEKTRLELLKEIKTDERFILTDAPFNNFEPSSFFKGVTSHQGLIKAKADSIEVMLIYGDAALVTEKGGEEDFNKHPMILDCQYFFSNKDSAVAEYNHILQMISPLYQDTSTIQNDEWESTYSRGTQKCTGKIFDHFDPYYRLAIASLSYIPSDGSTPVFVVDMAFSKEDK